MSKTKKVIILLILAILCATVSGFAIYQYCNSSKAFIYLFNGNYSAGTKINEDMFSPLKVDASIVDNGKNSSLDTYYITGDDFAKVVSSNEYLLNDVSTKKPFTFTDLALTSGTSIERSLSDGMMAVTIPISGTAAVTNDLRVGSIVNIYTVSTEKTEVLFEDMKIIGVNGSNNSISSVTFATNFDDTLKLINASNTQSLYFSLSQPISTTTTAVTTTKQNNVAQAFTTK